jgi:hypothetical protein
VGATVVVVVPPTTVDVVEDDEVVDVVVVAPGSVVVVDVAASGENVGTVDVVGPDCMTFAAPIAATPPTSTTAPPQATNRRIDDPVARCARRE